eukprot:scaffold255063_cov54-Attheya_sp.AAC.1
MTFRDVLSRLHAMPHGHWYGEKIGHSGRPNQSVHRFSANARDGGPSIDNEYDVIAGMFFIGARH